MPDPSIFLTLLAAYLSGLLNDDELDLESWETAVGDTALAELKKVVVSKLKKRGLEKKIRSTAKLVDEQLSTMADLEVRGCIEYSEFWNNPDVLKAMARIKSDDGTNLRKTISNALTPISKSYPPDVIEEATDEVYRLLLHALVLINCFGDVALALLMKFYYEKGQKDTSPGPYPDEAESGRFTVLPGVKWDQFAQHFSPDIDRRELSKHDLQYMLAFEDVCSAILFSSAIGYDVKKHGLAEQSEHPIHILKGLWGSDNRLYSVAPRDQKFNLQEYILKEEVRKDLTEAIGKLNAKGRLHHDYRELVLRDAEHYLGNDTTLKEKQPDSSEYKFGKGMSGEGENRHYDKQKDYVYDKELVGKINDAFVQVWDSDLEKKYGTCTIPQSRAAFVRRLMLTHLAIGHYYSSTLLRDTITLGGASGMDSLPREWGLSRVVFQEPTRSQDAIMATRFRDKLTEDLIQYCLPMFMATALETARKNPRDVLKALVDMREEDPRIRPVRHFIRQIDERLREGRTAKAQQIALQARDNVVIVARNSILPQGASILSRSDTLVTERLATVAEQISRNDNARKMWRDTFLRR